MNNINKTLTILENTVFDADGEFERFIKDYYFYDKESAMLFTRKQVRDYWNPRIKPDDKHRFKHRDSDRNWLIPIKKEELPKEWFKNGNLNVSSVDIKKFFKF